VTPVSKPTITPATTLPSQKEQRCEEEPVLVNLKPSGVAGIYGQQKAVKTFLSLVRLGGAFLFTGPPGCGKSSLVYSYCTEHNIRLIDLTVPLLEISDFTPMGLRVKRKRADDIITPEDRAKRLIFQACFGDTVFDSECTKKVVVIDDAETLPPNIWTVIVKCIIPKCKKAGVTLVVIVNNAFEGHVNKNRPLFTAVIQFFPINYGTTFLYLSSVNKTLRKPVHESVVKRIAKESNGDLRQTISMFAFHIQMSYHTQSKLGYACLRDSEDKAKIHLGNFERFKSCITANTVESICAIAEVESRLMEAFVFHNYMQCLNPKVVPDFEVASQIMEWISFGNTIMHENYFSTCAMEFRFFFCAIAPMYLLSQNAFGSRGKIMFPSQTLKSIHKGKKLTDEDNVVERLNACY
jgi:hypothetical protein